MVMKKITYICIALLAVCSLAYVIVLSTSPLPLICIDRDRSGLVSIGEAFDALNIGKRDIKDCPNCVEYYWLKDGVTAYISSPNNNVIKRVIKFDLPDKK